MPIIVQKFGGTSISDAEKIRRAAERVIKAVKNDRCAKHEVIVFHITDKTEEVLDISGNVQFRNME